MATSIRNKRYSIRVFFGLLLLQLCVFLGISSVYHTKHKPMIYWSLKRSQGFQNHILPFESVTLSDIALRFPGRPAFVRDLKRFLGIVVEEYGEWHREQRFLSEKNTSHVQTLPLLIFRGRSNRGLGDRFRGLLRAYLLAVVTERFFLIDLPEMGSMSKMLGNPLKNNFIYDPAVFSNERSEETIRGSKKSNYNLRKYLNSSRVIIETGQRGPQLRRFLSITTRYPQLPFALKIKKADLESFEVGESVVVPFLLQLLFETAPSLRRSLKEKDPFRGEAYLASHARLGHGVREGEKKRFNVEKEGLDLRSLSICFGRVVGMAAKHSAMNRIFLATDTANATKWIKEGVRVELPNAIVGTLKGQVAHVNSLRTEGGEDRMYEVFERAFVDLGLMARGKGLVALNSGFSRLAAWMGAHDDRNTIMFDTKFCRLLRFGAGMGGQNGECFKTVHMRTLVEKKSIGRWKYACNLTK